MLRTLLGVVVLTALIPGPPPALWDWPTEGPPLVLRDFRAPATPWGAGHRGLDLAATGTAIRAPTSGVVSFSGVVVDRGVMTITTAQGHKVSLEPVEALVPSGSYVARGQTVAILSEGHCAELCLHLGLRIEDRYRSPRRELGILIRAVLLPWDYYALG